MPAMTEDAEVRVREFKGNNSLCDELASFRHAKEQYEYFTPKIEDFCFRVLAGDAALIHALETGDIFALDLAGPEHWMVKDIMASILLAGSDALVGLSWEDRGKVVGYLLPEIIIAVAGTLGGEALGGPGGGAGGAVEEWVKQLAKQGYQRMMNSLEEHDLYSSKDLPDLYCHYSVFYQYRVGLGRYGDQLSDR